MGGWVTVRKRGAHTKPGWVVLQSTRLLSAASGEEGHKRNKRNTVASIERTCGVWWGEETKTPKRREEDFVGSAADFVYAVNGKSGEE